MYPPHQIGGYEIAAYDVAEGLKKLKHKVMVLTSNYKCNAQSPKEASVARKLKLTQNWEGKIARSVEEVEKDNYMQTKLILSQYKPDIIYFWNQCFLGGGPIQATIESKIPFLHHLMGNDIISYLKIPWWHKKHFSKLKGNLFSTMYQHSPRVLKNSIFISNSLQNDFRCFGIKPENAMVIYPGIEVDEIVKKTHYKLTPKKVSIVYVGQITAHKGVEVLVRALALIQANQKLKMSLAVYGEGDSNHILELGEKLGVKIKLKGFATKKRLYQKLHDYDIGVFPSIWKEPFGISQIEMMAAGLPVVSSAQGGSSEAIQNKITGLTFQNENHHDLALVLTDLINDYNKIASSLGNNARIWTKANYTQRLAIKHICDMMVDVINYN